MGRTGDKRSDLGAVGKGKMIPQAGSYSVFCRPGLVSSASILTNPGHWAGCEVRDVFYRNRLYVHLLCSHRLCIFYGDILDWLCSLSAVAPILELEA